MENALITYPDAQELETEGADALKQANAAEVVTRGDYDGLAAFGARLHSLEKVITLKCDGTESAPGFTKLAHRAWKKTLEFRDMYLKPVKQARALVSAKLGVWWESDQKRIATEQKARDQQARLDEAALRESEGASKTEVNKVLDGKTFVPVAPTEKSKQAPGVSIPYTYDIEITDFDALFKAVANGKVPEGAVMANQTFIKGQARLMKEKLAYPGVRVIKKAGARFR